MITLKQFIETARLPQSSTVFHDEWERLYVRRSKQYVNGEFIEVFVLANIVAKEPGNGAFGRLLKELPKRIVVECVQNPRFRKHLASNGWISVGDGFSFFKENF